MIMTTSDVVLSAISILAVVGIAISVSAWRHTVRMEREMDKHDDSGLPSPV